MNKANLKDILTVIRDTIKRNRVAYKDYLGEKTITKTNIIVEGTLVEEGALALKDSSVASFVIGESYDVTIDGVTEAMIAYGLSENSTGYGAPAHDDNIIALGNITDLSNLPPDGWVVAIGGGFAVCKTLGSYVGKSISISQTKTVTEKHYDIKKLPDELLPSTVAKKTDLTAVKKLATNAQATAETAQTTADAALNTADNAEATANNAQATAKNAQTTAENAQTVANTAKTTAETAKTTAETAKTTAETAKTTAKGAATKVDPIFTGSFSQNRSDGTVIGPYSHAEGLYTTASEYTSHAEGNHTVASGQSSHAEGLYTVASGYSSHAEGIHTTARGIYSHAEGCSSPNIPDTITSSSSNSEIIAEWETAKFSLAKGNSSHVEGQDNLALEDYSHAEGKYTIASGSCSHAEGNETDASGEHSHAEGNNTKACSLNQHVQGKYNVVDCKGKYAHIVGNGEDDSNRSNAHTLNWSGVPWFKGRPQFGGTAQDQGSQTVMANGDKEIILTSSTADSTKKFKITVDDNGAISATEVT